jgi:hypothetical protein
MMIGYDIYDCFTMEHFRLRQRMTLTIKIYCSRHICELGYWQVLSLTQKQLSILHNFSENLSNIGTGYFPAESKMQPTVNIFPKTFRFFTISFNQANDVYVKIYETGQLTMFYVFLNRKSAR